MASLLAAAKKAVSGKVQSTIAGAAQTALTQGKGIAGAAVETAEQKAAATALQGATGLSATESATVAKQASTLAGGTGAALSGIKSFFTSTGTAIKSFGSYLYGGLNPFSGNSSIFQIVIVWVPIFCIILGIVFYIGSKRGWFAPKPTASTTAATLNAAVSANASPPPGAILATAPGNAEIAKGSPAPIKEGFAASTGSTSTDPNTLPLVSLQPLTIKQAGFLGPLPNGAFEVANATGNALKAGFRSFTLQIDYLDTKRDSTKFASVGSPTLLYHGDDGSLISTNSGSISEVAKTISALAFRPEVPNYSQPVILYLHILRAPSPVKAQDEYLAYLSKIAQELNPIAPNHLGMSPLGVFHRQKNEETLINSPISSFEGNVIVLCNADTSLFRSSILTTKYEPKNDLDYWVNMRVYLNSEFETFGLTQTPPSGVTANAVIVSLGSILGMSTQRMEVFSSKKKSQFVIAMPANLTNPSYKDLGTALSSAGVNMVPLDIFSDTLTNVKNLVQMYSNKTYNPKPAALRHA